MRKLNKLSRTIGFAALSMTLVLASCKKKDIAPINPPAVENEEEVITDIKLIFTNVTDPNDVVEASAQDPDGAGVQELAILDEINLHPNKTYRLTYQIMNNLGNPGEDIEAEIANEAVDHQIFYSFSNNAFSNPLGNGNSDAPSDPLNYNDMDSNGNPIGLSTNWTTPSSSLSAGSFTVRLQHQPGIKSSSS